MTTIPDILLPIVRELRTKEERDLLREQVFELEAAMFRTDTESFEKILRTQLPENIAASIRDIIMRPELKNNPQALQIFFQQLGKALNELPLLNLILGFKPSQAMVDRLREWAREHLGVNILLDIGYDGLMLGGVRIIFNGRYKEMTLAKMITSVLIKEKATLMKMLK